MNKRLFDLIASGVGLSAIWPLFVLAAVAIKLESEGPVFFTQERVGRRFRPFRIFKFRTMVSDASRLGPAITAGSDSRITRVGALLRRFKIDELPQLLNVVRGEMSLVGPRPEVPRYVEMFRDQYEEILSVRPGITDFASFEFSNEAEVLAEYDDPERAYVEEILPQKLEMARRYVESASMSTDVEVIVKTLGRIVAGR